MALRHLADPPWVQVNYSVIIGCSGGHALGVVIHQIDVQGAEVKPVHMATAIANKSTPINHHALNGTVTLVADIMNGFKDTG